MCLFVCARKFYEFFSSMSSILTRVGVNYIIMKRFIKLFCWKNESFLFLFFFWSHKQFKRNNKKHLIDTLKLMIAIALYTGNQKYRYHFNGQDIRSIPVLPYQIFSIRLVNMLLIQLQFLMLI